jgi:phosphoribosylaminoimidazolecarboxamide formyltransferase / IMP cyclohydrolase
VTGTRRIAVAVSGAGSNLRALRRAERRGLLGGEIVLVVADRECPAVAWAAGEGIATAVVRPADHADREAWDGALAAALTEARPDLVVLAGFMRVVGGPVLRAFGRRIVNVHPSLLPSFPGTHAIADALAAGVRYTGVTVHLVDSTLDGGPIVLQETVPVLSTDDEASLAERMHAVEHRLLPRAVALLLAGAARVAPRGVTVDPVAAARSPSGRRALLSVSDKRGLPELGRALVELGFELVSTGGTARALRDAGLEVIDVSSVTGTPEMLDGRVKTLHPRIAAGVLADLRLESHRSQLAAAGIDPIEVVVVNLYPFAAAAARPGTTADELVEEIDIGGPTLVRAAAKNHASVGIVTDPATYDAVVEELRLGPLSDATRRRLAADAFAHTAAYDAMIAEVLPGRIGVGSAARAAGADATVDGAAVDPNAASAPAADAGAPADARFPERRMLELERVQELRYGENPHQAAALYRVVDEDPASGPFARGVQVLGGKALSYNNILDAAAAAGLARSLRGSACVVVKHTNPCGVVEAGDLPAAWELALAGDPVSAFGGVVAVRGTVDALLAERLTSIFLEVVVASAFDDAALARFATRPNVRLVVDPSLEMAPTSTVEYRSAGGALLATDADVAPDDPAAWRVATARAPTPAEMADLDLAWRIGRHVKSNAIVLVRGGTLVGVGAGQMSRVDSARLAVAKAGAERARGAVCASDAFYPFPDALEVCAEAGVTAFVQPGGSQRDAEVIAAADAAGAAMLLTGTRHFRH